MPDAPHDGPVPPPAPERFRVVTPDPTPVDDLAPVDPPVWTPDVPLLDPTAISDDEDTGTFAVVSESGAKASRRASPSSPLPPRSGKGGTKTPLPAGGPSSVGNAVSGVYGVLALLTVFSIPWLRPNVADVLDAGGRWTAWLTVDAKRSFALSFFEPLLALAVLARLVSEVWATLQRFLGGQRDGAAAWRRAMTDWARCVGPAFVLFGAAAVSLWAGPADGEGWGLRREVDVRLAVKTLAQWAEYLLVLPWVLLPLWRSPSWRGWLGIALGAGLTAAAATAWVGIDWTAVHAGGDPFATGGVVGHRHAYTAVMALGACLWTGWWAERLRGRRWTPGGLLGFFVPVAFWLAPSLSLGVLLAGCGGLAVAWAAARRGLGWLTFALVGWLGWWGPMALNAVAPAPEANPATEASTPSGDALRDPAAAHRRWLTRSIQPWREDARAPEKGERPTMRYRRWGGELNMVLADPIHGVGVGQYKYHIERGMVLPPDRGRTDDPAEFDLRVDEPGTHGWFFLLAGEMGVLGLGAWMTLLAALAARAMGWGGRVRCWGAVGVLGVGVVLLLGGWWTGWLVRGVGPLVGLALSMSSAPSDDYE